MTKSTVLTLVGSLRAESTNQKLAEAIQLNAPEQVDVVIHESLGNIPFYNEDLDVEGQVPAAAAALRAAAEEADTLLLVTPEHNGTVPAALKNAIDWLSRLPEQPLSGKPVLIQTSSMGAIGGARCQYHLRQILVFLDAMVMNKPEFMGGVIQNKVDPQTGEVVDQSTRDHLSGQLTAFGDYIKRVKA